MTCEEFIYRVSYYKSKKHLKSWKDEHYLTELETRYIYDFSTDTEISNNHIKVFVIKVCNKSDEFKQAVLNGKNKNVNFATIN